MARGFVLAIVGAESTGKTLLALGLRMAFTQRGRHVAVVDEFLREFCDRAGRTPHQGEQQGIAAEQTRRIEAAVAEHDLVIADTTALTTAVYSEWVFGDTTLYPAALSAHARCDLTLLTALDVAWQADGLQRDGPHVREPIDALVRAALARAGAAYAVVGGLGDARLQAAVASVDRAMAARQADLPDPPPQRWQWCCERCSDPACERLALRAGTGPTGLTASSSSRPAGSIPE